MNLQYAVWFLVRFQEVIYRAYVASAFFNCMHRVALYRMKTDSKFYRSNKGLRTDMETT
jgi:hypothetical protein